VVETLKVTVEERRVNLSIPRPLPTIRCDRARIGEVFRNLITNGIKYNRSPEPLVEVGYFSAAEWAARRTDPGDAGEFDVEGGVQNIFYVRDNGIGIRKKHHESVFRIFKRLHGRNKFEGGTGAGLTIVKKIVSRHGGRIWIDSEYRKGSTFYFTLDGEQANESLEHEVYAHSAG
jgi:light-regulated signal transduction histidine kinase (bacteriophytochrome)